jgi:hypothetical protein
VGRFARDLEAFRTDVSRAAAAAGWLELADLVAALDAEAPLATTAALKHRIDALYRTSPSPRRAIAAGACAVASAAHQWRMGDDCKQNATRTVYAGRRDFEATTKGAEG